MTEERHDRHNDAGPEANEPREDRHDRRHPGRRPLRLGLTAIALVALGAVATTAFKASAHGGMGWRERHSALTVDTVRTHALDRAEWVLDAIDATPDQREQINTILGDLVATLHPFTEQHRESRRELVTELTRPTPDLDALERLRAREIAVIDDVSREAVAALGRATEILTPAQRVELADRIGRFRRH